ncbi:MAG: hypothetical protein ACREBD_19145, partial [Blastocatellia bacterium]
MKELFARCDAHYVLAEFQRQSMTAAMRYGEHEPLVSTQVVKPDFVPKGRRILAGGETTGTEPTA